MRAGGSIRQRRVGFFMAMRRAFNRSVLVALVCSQSYGLGLAVTADPPEAPSAEGLAIRNATAAHAFLARNAKLKGIHALPSGLQYKILAEGDTKAQSPQPTDDVSVRFRGTFMDGTEFDSSSRHSQSTSFIVNTAMPGWQEALVLMKPHAKWRLYVPPELGYGQMTRHGVPGGSLLIFDLELVAINRSPLLPPASH